MKVLRYGSKDVTIRFTVKDGNGDTLDISSATAMSINFLKPDNTQVTKTGSFYTDGTDGIVKYVTEEGFLDILGIWVAQAEVTLSSGGPYPSEEDKFRVRKNWGS